MTREPEPLWKELVLITFSAPAALSVVAALDKRLDFRPFFERIILSLNKFSSVIWSEVSIFINFDISAFSNELTFIALSLIPFFISLYIGRGRRPFFYYYDVAEESERLKKVELDEVKSDYPKYAASYFKKASYYQKNDIGFPVFVSERLYMNIFLKVLISSIASLIIFLVFGIIYSVAFVISSSAIVFGLAFLIFNVINIKANPNGGGIIEVMGFFMSIWVLAAIWLAVYWSYKIQFIDKDFTYMILATAVGTFAIIVFVVVVSYRIFTYLHICLWALGIYTIDRVTTYILPSFDMWLRSHGI
ncbi:MAG: hypothetical protein AAF183_13095 [Pseudomonadota bacterium]